MAPELPTEPFGTEDLHDYRLRSGPLSRVIVQLRFPHSTELQADTDRILEIARALSEEYPVFEQGNEVNFNVTPAGVVPIATSTPRWQFRSINGLDVAVITPTSLAFETSSYSSRDSLLDAIRTILSAALPVIRAVYIERVGVRYTNHVTQEDVLRRLDQHFRNELIGSVTIPRGTASLTQTFTETVFALPDERGLGVRSGLIPAGATLDSGLAPHQGESFVLDLDAFHSGRMAPKEHEPLVEAVSKLAESAYRFFLWSLTPEGFDHFGGHEK